MNQTVTMVAISVLVGIACGGFLWFGTDLTMKLRATLINARARRAAVVEEVGAPPAKEPGGGKPGR